MATMFSQMNQFNSVSQVKLIYILMFQTNAVKVCHYNAVVEFGISLFKYLFSKILPHILLRWVCFLLVYVQFSKLI